MCYYCFAPCTPTPTLTSETSVYFIHVAVDVDAVVIVVVISVAVVAVISRVVIVVTGGDPLGVTVHLDACGDGNAKGGEAVFFGEAN